MCEIWTMGEMLVEIMRPRPDMELYRAGEFIGPFPSGAPAIFIDTVARLGHSAGIFGGVGRDDFGRCILDRLKQDGVNTEYVYEDEILSTAVAFVTYFKDGTRKFIYHIGNTPAVKTKEFNIEDIPIPKFFHIMGCSLMADEEFAAKILRTALYFAKRGTKISFDPNIRIELLLNRDIEDVLGGILNYCSVLFPGKEELAMLTGHDSVEAGIKKLFDHDRTEIVVLKRGSKGCTVYSRQEHFDCKPYKIDSVDPTGAGDCFDAAFLCGMLEGLPLEKCGRMAAAAGALNAMKLGPMEGEISKQSIYRMITV